MMPETESLKKECQICGSVVDATEIKHFMTFDMCPACKKKEEDMQAEIKATENERIVKMHASAALTIAESKKVDSTIRYNGDIYNAEVVAIVQIEDAINKDDTIAFDQKYFMLAKVITEKRDELAPKLFEAKSLVNDLETKQVVHQRKLNELAEKLTKEERDKLKIIAINYKPTLSKEKPSVKIPTLGKKSENLALVLRDYPKMNLDDAKLAALYLDRMNRRTQAVTTADAVNFVNSTK